MSGVRRSHWLALFGGAALLLLLLARLPPPARLHLQPRAELPADPQPGGRPDAVQAPYTGLRKSHERLQQLSLQLQLEWARRGRGRRKRKQLAVAAGGTASVSASPSSVAANSTPASAAPPARASAAVAAAPAAKPQPRVVLTKDLYEAGHSQAHPELCPALGAGVRLLVLVTSAPAHAAARQGVRLTWGHFARRRDVTLAFMLGQPAAHLAAAIAEEDALYGDLIMGRFQDSYSNLTLKSLSMLEWADTYCARARRLLKTDDDMFINVPRLLAFIDSPQRANATNTIWGKVLKKSLPKRTAKSKYYLSPLQYAGRVLPDFATGPAYLLTSDLPRALLRAAPPQPYVRLEDVFLTGILADTIGARRTHAPEFYNKKVSPHPCAVQRGVAIHMVRYHEQFDLWRKLLDGRTKCS